LDYAFLAGADLSEITQFKGVSLNGADWWRAGKPPEGEFLEYLKRHFPKKYY
jgi:hypothetical protein